MDLIIHAPVNGVIKGIPDNGLEAQELADLGFRRVFAGHYHDHKVFCGGKVISIGATSHQTWNDPGTKAGFLLVYEDHIEHFESSAPKFVDLTDHEIDTPEGLEMVVSGNYVRLKIDDAEAGDVENWRRQLSEAGALASNIIVSSKKDKAVSRTGTTVSASSTLEASVAEYVTNNLKPDNEPDVQALCSGFIEQARSEAA